MGNTPNQGNYQSSQQYKIDINQIYKDFIQEIDESRSITNTNNQVDNSALNSFDAKTITGINKSVKIEDTPQESRLHCFYRLIGFPVIDKTGSNQYNPGHDIIDGEDEKKDEKKLTIAKNLLDKYKEFSIKRENYINSIKEVFDKQPSTITATVLALSSGRKVRPFSAPLKNDEPFDFEKEQIYTPDFTSTIGGNSTVLLTDYVDELGNPPDQSSLIKDRTHFIKPFAVDPRIDFSCNPASRKVAVPFVPNKTKLLVSENTFVKRPLIEKIIRERFSVADQKKLSSSEASVKDIILSIPTITDETLIQKMSSDIYGLNDKVQFKKYLDIIATMCKELYQSQHTIESVQAAYYWLPVPSTSGPEGGCGIKPIIISGKLPDGEKNTFITTADRALIHATLRNASNFFNTQTIGTEGVQDPGNFAFGPIETTFNDDTSSAFGDLGKEELDSLTKTRDHDLQNANDALRKIEIIMGEFSGLGLCDIIAIMAALYTMPKRMLLGFLDESAYQRMIKSLDLGFSALPSDSKDPNSKPNDPDLEKPQIKEAQVALVKQVKNFYNLMDDIYKQIRENANRNRDS